jgi:hypothetical protein
LSRPSSKWRQSSNVYTLIHKWVRVEEKKIVDGESQIDKGGYGRLSISIILKCFKFLKNFKICS